jgi:hypothetical protein
MSMERSFAWWCLAESAARSLTTPSDIARSDADIEYLVTLSSLFGAGRSIAAKAGRAWIDSRTVRGLRPIVRDLLPPSMVDRVRIAGLVATIGAMTALVLQALEPMRAGRFDSMLPAAAAVAGVLVFRGARPLARALADKRQ